MTLVKDGRQTQEVPRSSYNGVFVGVSLGVAILGSIIGLQLITTLGISPNTSIIGALIAMIIARIPLKALARFKNIHNQNLLQTTISAATFGTANSLLIPIGIPYALGMPELVKPLLVGVAFALIFDALMLFWVFDSKLFGANEVWPAGVATAEAIKAGDQGGEKAKHLGIGVTGGILGAVIGVPMSAFGTAFIGNIFALTAFGVGLLASSYAEPILGVNVADLYIPHGVMIGAGIVALGQFVGILYKNRESSQSPVKESVGHGLVDETKGTGAAGHTFTRSTKDVTRAFSIGFALYMSGALLIAVLGGVLSELSPLGIVGFVLYAAFGAFMTEIIVGIAAMHSGWFPAFAVTLIFLVVGILLQFPTASLALLTGYIAATGPAFADMGFDFKTGFILRKGQPSEIELFGRKQQVKAGIIGFFVAIAMVTLAHDMYFSQDLLPPVDRVFARTIEAGADPEVAKYLLLWSVPGALIQLIGGTRKQIGIMLATGLLLVNPKAGWAVLVGILIRVLILKIKGRDAEGTMYTLAAGFIAGDAIYSFGSSSLKAVVK